MTPEKITDRITAIARCDILEEIMYYLEHGSWRSGVRIGLIIEGGALRGVVSCGYAKALRELVPARAFPAIYGSSSGALNSVYFAADQLDTALSIYAENATDKNCTNIWNFPDVLNPDWLVDEWMFGKKAFNTNSVINGPSDVFLALTRLDNGRPEYFNARGADVEDLRKAMKATSYAPLLSNRTQTIQGIRYGDGAIGDSIPYDRAISDGCTHLICLLTRPRAYRKTHGWFQRALENARLSHHSREFRNAYFARGAIYSALLDRLYVTGEATVPTLIISPGSSSERPGNIETRSDVIRAFGRLSYENAKDDLRGLL